ncbi:hypothetical protein CBW65_00795 [Tumebacillus avium]|uniref:FAD-dependent oxidoreductase n=1 Tax=Tumebacillus avium TaxID=1903704 RepID=A0A1Y0IK45_9BACL|nr:FAD-dependent oxidoreductase [Tumebacillus avium]ARU59744.1 hypothetical protein CBW65_00795 [Tumebacillus avium]
MADYTYDIVIYGGTFAGVAAAAKAGYFVPGKQILVIVNDVAGMLGGTGTSGGQNYMDTKGYTNGLATQGTFAWWFSQHGQFYNTDAMHNQMYNDLAKYPNVKFLWAFDVENYSYATSPFRITNLTVRNIYRDETTGYVRYGGITHNITGTVFIDASDEGRLARLANFGGTTGRYDWPAQYLDTDEQGPTGRGRQQAATLMFKVTGVAPSQPVTDGNFVKDADGTWGYWGGGSTYANNPVVTAFNAKYGPQGYLIKSMNVAQNGTNSAEWWMNCLLVFNVDGRAHDRDRNSWRFPTDMRTDYRDVDTAWVQARNFIRDTPEFLSALRQFPGFGGIQLVKDAAGNPVVGNILYIRETIHNAINAAIRGNGTENNNYEVAATESVGAGSSPTTGTDTANYATRIGLGFYWPDINAYEYTDLRNTAGQWILGSAVSLQLRPDLGGWTGGASNPVYLPYNAITTNYVANLLLPGYATGVSSYSWSELRVLPNLAVLGDAAGVTAAYAVNNGKHPLYFTSGDIANVQSMLRTVSARLDK